MIEKKGWGILKRAFFVVHVLLAERNICRDVSHSLHTYGKPRKNVRTTGSPQNFDEAKHSMCCPAPTRVNCPMHLPDNGQSWLMGSVPLKLLLPCHSAATVMALGASTSDSSTVMAEARGGSWHRELGDGTQVAFRPGLTGKAVRYGGGGGRHAVACLA